MQESRNDAEDHAALPVPPGWRRIGDRLCTTWELPDFAAAASLSRQIAALAASVVSAEARPEWTVRERQLTVVLRPRGDFEPAARLQDLAAAAGATVVPADRAHGGGALWVQPGHFYSPITDAAEVEADAARLFAPGLRRLAGIDLRLPQQMQFVRELARYHDADFAAAPRADRRFCLANEYFPHSDAFAYQALLRHLRPAHVIEVGAGWSTAVLFDTDERFLGASIRCTIVEPFPDRVLQLLRPADLARSRLLRQRLQDVPLDEFRALAANDILFIDSSHVAKTGSDVLHALFEVLPVLRPGVWVHVHDVHANFEYPQDWVREGRSWNESYFVRAFLMHNQQWQIQLHGASLGEYAPAELQRLLPGIGTNAGGSLWLSRL